MPTPTDDPDLAHLFDLLSMLPGPREDRQFWAAIRAYALGDEEPETATMLDYVFEKMASIPMVLRDPSSSNVFYLAKYLLFFFSGDDPQLWSILGRVTSQVFSLNHDYPGRFWAKDVCETSWALLVRYRTKDDQWTRKWQFEESGTWLDWLDPPGRPTG